MSDLLDEHRGYISDPVRAELFRKACALVVQEGDLVTDLGCGVGILSLLCLHAGADHCYAIERGPIIAKAKEAFRQAGWVDKTTLLQRSVDKVRLDRKVDVAICDHVGNLGIDYGLIDLLQTARHLHLKAGAQIIPRRLDLEIAPVFSDALYGRVDDWKTPHVPKALHFLADQALGEKYGVYFSADEIIGPAIGLSTLDLTKDQPDLHLWEAELLIEQPGQMNGLGTWFQCELAEDIWMTNSPLAARPIKRKQVFVPIRPIKVRVGDRVNVTMMARPADGIYTWDIESGDGCAQSYTVMPPTLASAHNLRTSVPGFVPELNKRGERRLAILELCDGQRSGEEIRKALLETHPEMFTDEADVRAEMLSVMQQDVI